MSHSNEPPFTEGESALAVAESTDPCCEKCAAPLKSGVVTVCRSCGWYASLGMFVEVDQAWEVATSEAPSLKQQPATSHLGVWMNLIPRWGWIILGSVVAVAMESVAVRFATPVGSSLRMIWSIVQLAIGLILALGCHIFNFLVLAASDAEIGLLDLFLKPLRLWIRTCQRLPKRLTLVNAAACSIMAVLGSVVIIGSLPYERLWDWGFKAPPKQNLMGAVMDRMKEIETTDKSDNLEDAVSDFAGSQNLEPENKPQTKPLPKPPKAPERADCVVLGFQLDRDGQLGDLLLGTAQRSALVYAGRVTPALSPEEKAEMLAALKALVIKQPFVPVGGESGIWVKPAITCRVTFDEQSSNGRLRGLKWEELLGTLRVE
ncbi:MAG: hypothetical protein IT425_13795 [Pirellulales bacterium]|nr:hypothetical protein [Pirellulales bacterium]